MTRAIARIDACAAPLTLANLAVYAITGAYGGLHGKRPAEPAVRYVEYHPAEGETSRQTSERVAASLGLTLATPVQSAAIQHAPPGDRLLDFDYANGRHKVTLLLERNRLRIEITRSSPARRADILHETTGSFIPATGGCRSWPMKTKSRCGVCWQRCYPLHEWR